MLANQIDAALNLVKDFQALHQSRIEQQIDSAQLIDRIIEQARQWLKLYQQAPQSLCALYFLTDDLTLIEQRYLKTNLLLLSLIESLHLTQTQAINLLCASALRDIAIFNSLNKTKTELRDLLNDKQFKAKLYKSCQHSAKQAELIVNAQPQVYLANLNQLIAYQYEFTNGSGLYRKILAQVNQQQFCASQLFSFCCHLVNLDILYPQLVNWQLQLKFIARNQFHKIDSYLLNLLYQQWGQFPAGSLVSYQQQACRVFYLAPANDDFAIIYQNNQLIKCPLAKLSALDQTFETEGVLTIRQAYKTQLLPHLDELNIKLSSAKLVQFSLNIDPQSRLLNQHFKQNDEPLDYLAKALQIQTNRFNQAFSESFKQTTTQNLIEYAYSLNLPAERAANSSLSVNQASMYLGSDALQFWLPHHVLKSPLLNLKHQFSEPLKQYLFLAQNMSAQLAKYSDSVHPEQAKLLLCCLFYPYFYHPKITIYANQDLQLATHIHQLLKLNKTQTHLSVELARNCGLSFTEINALAATTQQSKNHYTETEKSLISSLKLSILAIGLIFKTPQIFTLDQLAEQANPVYDETLQSLACLNLDWDSFCQLVQHSVEEHHYFCPLTSKLN
ncbi:hypothetical protein N7931_10610 [Catenovulum sp. 2E275]|uniref:hypothetical protein n=1 Tax=Catenovulum sp. 2E275 TaxID=2980497 RepID=UPI0021D1B512|nr:hypothetical protein [Catenovulum sp. 2E275]MCU4676085.1 hypothetical protein [Catenovulum sp. 2E275]